MGARDNPGDGADNLPKVGAGRKADPESGDFPLSAGQLLHSENGEHQQPIQVVLASAEDADDADPWGHDFTAFVRAGRDALAILDLVSRKWITTLTVVHQRGESEHVQAA